MSVKTSMRRMLLFRLALVASAALSVWATTPCHAFEMGLPAVGAMINFEFKPPERVLSVARGAPSAAAFSAQATFADAKTLWKRPDPSYAPEDFVNLAIIFRGDGIKSVLMGDLRRFDEYASLLGPYGAVLETARNSSYGYYENCDDYFQFGWDFHTTGNLPIHGFAWEISPDEFAGRQLPSQLDIEAYLWGSPIFVVPEPHAAAIAAVGSLALAAARSSSRRTSRRPCLPRPWLSVSLAASC